MHGIVIRLCFTAEATEEDLAIVQAQAQDTNCEVSPCANNGTCEDGLDTFFCYCASGWTGKTCGVGKICTYMYNTSNDQI